MPAAAEEGARFRVAPAEMRLDGNFAQGQFLLTALDANGEITKHSVDVTAEASFTSLDPAVAKINDHGQVVAVGNGETTVQMDVNGKSIEAKIIVENVQPAADARYVEHIRPILAKAGCASAACHAAQHGQGGFKLSVFGFDPQADHEAIVRDRLARRVNMLQPENSLLLQKPTMRTPHGGGRRLTADSPEASLLKAWIARGCPPPAKDAPEVERLTVMPIERVGKVGQTQQLRVEAVYTDGQSKDVTAWAKFDSLNDGVVTVDEQGRTEIVGQGQGVVMVRFEGQAETSAFVVPYAESVDLADWNSRNFIDELAAAKFRELAIEPSPLCDDATFIRRAFLDATGSLPTPSEVAAFLDSDDSNKRDLLVDRLLGLTGDPALDLYNDRYAAWWTLKWSDLIRNTSTKLGDQGMWALHNWIKESFRTNKPFDQFVRELVTAKGSIYSNGPANYFRINSQSTDLTESTAQLFLGVRLECAKCHHHPFENYSQADYYRLSAFFARVGTKNSQEFGLFGREQVVVVRSSGSVRHPRTREVMAPTPLGGEPMEHPIDLRIPLAQWLTSPDNKMFARSVVNRYMGYLLGRGLVEPLDDMRSSNPASNPALLDALAEQFVQSEFDLKQLMRTVMTSRLYQLSSQPTKANAGDQRFYSHYKVKRLKAEALLDALDHAAGTQTKFKSLPSGTRATELPDAEYPNYFLTTFAKPRRASVCECERSPDENLAQALHTLNGEIVDGKVADKNGRVAKLVKANKPHEQIVGELYMAALCQPATDAEIEAAREFLDQSESPQQCYEDLLWALVNSKQFLFVR